MMHRDLVERVLAACKRARDVQALVQACRASPELRALADPSSTVPILVRILGGPRADRVATCLRAFDVLEAGLASRVVRGLLDDSPGQGRRVLARAIELGNATACRELLWTLDHVDAPVFRGGSALLRAAQGCQFVNSVSTVSILLDAGADVVADGGHALVAAARRGRAGVVALLLAAGSDPNSVDGDGASALANAASAGHVDVLRALVDAGADVEARDLEDGATALMRAAEGGHVAALSTLVHAGADVHAVDEEGATALVRAARAGRCDAIRTLVRAGADVDATYGQGGTTALMDVAVEGVDVPTLATLLDAGAELDAVDAGGRTALMHAVAHGADAGVLALLAAH